MKLPQAIYKRPGNRESKRSSPKVYQFAGYNANSIVQPGQLKTMTNCGSDNFPCISNRGPRTQITTLTTPNALFSANSVRVEVDGTSFKYNAVAKGTVTSGAKSMVEISYYNTTAQQQQSLVFIFPDCKYYNITTDVFGNIGTGTYPAAGSCPAIDYATSYNNRVFGVKGNQIYASKFNNPFNFTTFDGTNSAAWADYTIDMSSFIGIANFQNHVTMFKTDSIIELYGDNANNFYKKEVSKKGCIDGKSIVEVNGLLYFLSKDGVNSYGGGLPRLISYELNQAYVSGAAGTDGRKYYISLYNGSTYDLFVYDTLHGLWHREDALRVVDFTNISGYLYALTNESTPKILQFKYGTETISWIAETEIFDENELNKKYYSKLMAKVELETGSTLSIYISVDQGAYELINTFTATKLQVISQEIAPRRCNNFQIKFTGTGNFKIYALQRETDIATDR